MTVFCTIFGRTADFAAIASAFDGVPGAKVTIRGTPSRWQSIKITLDPWSLTLTSRQRKRPGDTFSKMIGGAIVYANDARAKDKQLKQQVLDVIRGCELAIGVAVKPSADAAVEAHIFRCAGLLDGIVFDGQSFFSPRGKLLLRGSGA